MKYLIESLHAHGWYTHMSHIETAMHLLSFVEENRPNQEELFIYAPPIKQLFKVQDLRDYVKVL